MRFNAIRNRLPVYCLLSVLLLQIATSVSAHGGGQPRITNQTVGDYAISVWTNPTLLQTGEIHVTVALAQEQAAALNRDIRLVVAPIGNGQSIESAVTHEKSANKFMYEADFEIRRAGTYQFTISVDDLAQTVSFEAEILPQPSSGSQWIWYVALVAAGVVSFAARQLKRRKNG